LIIQYYKLSFNVKDFIYDKKYREECIKQGLHDIYIETLDKQLINEYIDMNKRRVYLKMINDVFYKEKLQNKDNSVHGKLKNVNDNKKGQRKWLNI
jgi:hypothetical protein